MLFDMRDKEQLNTELISKAKKQRVSVLELAGCQSIGELVQHGRVRLHGQDGSSVDLWDPRPRRPSKTLLTVRFAANLSEAMKKRYPQPLPQEATTTTYLGDAIEIGSEIFGGRCFEIDDWRPTTFLTLRDISRIELIVARAQKDAAIHALGAEAVRAVTQQVL